MKISILTLFPEMFDGFLTNSIIKRAIAKKVVEIEIVNIRDFTKDKYGRVDTPPIGGGAGLIMKCQPIIDALNNTKSESSKTILFSPRGKTYDENKAKELSKENHLILICGHYEGIDERVNKYVDEQISIGDYILTGGEIPAMAVSDSIIRLLDGAIATESLENESFNDNLLEYPQYTEPYSFEGDNVPDILYSGNHKAIEKWRKTRSLVLTRKYRPDLFAKLSLSKEEKKLLEDYDNNITPKWELEALEKGHKFIK
ncbi:MAG: tRNA (guanosine(37)-N1)-methyltransferase TrmD [Bacilli bacterium]|nr:tRNA (guanosine(37)-N1)-methyltransferase TrmD [Bacilli bacterium]